MSAPRSQFRDRMREWMGDMWWRDSFAEETDAPRAADPPVPAAPRRGAKLYVPNECGSAAMIELLRSVFTRVELASACYHAARIGREDAFVEKESAAEDERTAPVDAAGLGEMTPLMCACKAGHSPVVRVLLAAGANTAAQDVDGFTALHFACREGDEAIVGQLLAAGCDTAATDSVRCTPLHVAVRNSHEGIVRLLLEHGAGVDARDRADRTPLHWASERGGTTVASFLLALGAAAGARDELGRTPLHLASAAGHLAVVRLLLDAGADIDALDQCDDVPLMLASGRGHYAVVRHLIDAGCDLAAERSPCTALHHAVQCEQELVVRLLIQSGVDLERSAKVVGTPMCMACRTGNGAIVAHLILSGAKVTLNDIKKWENTDTIDQFIYAPMRAVRALRMQMVISQEECALMLLLHAP